MQWINHYMSCWKSQAIESMHGPHLLLVDMSPLLQGAPNATLRSETLWQNCVRCINCKRDVKKPSIKMQNVCDGRDIKHRSYFSYVCDAGHTVDPAELFMMRKNNRNGQPYQCVCDIQHTVHSDELVSIREHNRNGRPDEGECDKRHAVHSHEMFALR